MFKVRDLMVAVLPAALEDAGCTVLTCACSITTSCSPCCHTTAPPVATSAAARRELDGLRHALRKELNA